VVLPAIAEKNFNNPAVSRT